MKKFIILASACITALSLSAQPAFQQRVAVSMSNAATMTLNTKNDIQPRFLSIRALAPEEEENLTCQYGKLVRVMKEDFSKFTAGSEAEPDTKTSIKYNDGEYPAWWNIDPKYTTLPNWGADNVFQAGGVAYFDTLAVEDRAEGARINTPLLNCSANDGLILLRFKARSATPGKTSRMMMVEAAETHNMAAHWDVLGSAAVPEVTENWQTFEAVFQGGRETTMFNIVNFIEYTDRFDPSKRNACSIFLDDVEVFTIEADLKIPTNLSHSDYQGTSFRLNWEAVENATSYKVTLFSVETNDYGQVTKYNYVFQNQVAAENHMDVTGVVSGETYYFTVTAVNDAKLSVTSHPAPVYQLVMPELKEIAMMNNAKSYKAEWTEVPGAQRYHYMAYSRRFAREDEEFVIVDEHFENLKDDEGNSTFWTIEDNPGQSYDEHFIPWPEMTMAGWCAYSYAPFQGYVALDAFHWAYNGAQATLQSPELDLSKDNGKFTVSVKFYGMNSYGLDDEKYQTKAVVALFNYNDELGDYEQVEMYKPDNVTEAWTEHTLTFTKGSKRSILGIFAVDGIDYLFIDDLKITQNYKKDESLISPFLMKDYCAETSVDVNIPDYMQNRDIYHAVCAMKRGGVDLNPLGGGYLSYTTPYTELAQISKGSYVGVKLNEMAEVNVVLNNNVLSVDNVAGDNVRLYTVAGQFVASDNSGADKVEFTLNNRGAYIVFVGKQAVKVIY